MTKPDVPRYDQLMWPTLLALKQLGGSGSVQEIAEKVIELGDYTEAQTSLLHKEGASMSELEYRLHWARTHLKGIGALENSARGVWAITEAGRKLPEEEQVLQQVKEFRTANYKKRKGKKKQQEETDSELEEAPDWKDQLLATLQKIKPDAFERLSQRLLRECGFQSVKVTGKSGDGGIDGVGMYRMSLLTFPTLFQCKRYKGSVPPKEIRDFRGAMQGRAEKGLFITTGTFSHEAKNEARRDGATPVELIDGGSLCELLKEYELGFSTKQRIEEDVTVEAEFFDDL